MDSPRVLALVAATVVLGFLLGAWWGTASTSKRIVAAWEASNKRLFAAWEKSNEQRYGKGTER